MITNVDDKSGKTAISMKIHDYNTRLVSSFINHICTVNSVCLKQLNTEAPWREVWTHTKGLKIPKR